MDFAVRKNGLDDPATSSITAASGAHVNILQVRIRILLPNRLSVLVRFQVSGGLLRTPAQATLTNGECPL
jgi:hypothetical protein